MWFERLIESLEDREVFGRVVGGGEIYVMPPIVRTYVGRVRRVFHSRQ